MKKLLLIFTGIAMSFSVSFSQNAFDLVEVPTEYNSFFNQPKFVIDNADNKWIGSNSNGLIKFDGSEFTPYNTSNCELASDQIKSLYASEGILYVGTFKGLSVLDNGNWINYENTGTKSLENVICVFENDSKIYVGTLTNGLSIFDGNNWVTFDKSNSSMTSNKVIDICYGNDGKIWFATNNYNLDKGAIHCIVDGVVKTYSYADIDSENEIDEILSVQSIDGIGTIVLSTNTGVYGLQGLSFAKLFINHEYDFSFNRRKLGTFKNRSEAYFSDVNFLYFIKNSKIEVYPSLKFNKPILSTDSEGNIWFINTSFANKTFGKFSPDNYASLFESGNRNTKYNYKHLDVNNVKAGYSNRGDMFTSFNEYKSGYEVPKNSMKTSIYASGFWMAGINAEEEVAGGCMRWHLEDEDFSAFLPGPLKVTGDDQGNTDSIMASKYDRIWKIDRKDIENFKYFFELGDVANGNYTIPSDILDWPAHGEEGYAENLAPFVDVDEDGVYDPMKGDYPEIKGDQMLYWIFNDNLAKRQNDIEGNEEKPMGVEVHASAYAFVYDNDDVNIDDSIDAINYTTFLNFKSYNRSKSNYNSVFNGFWTDFDLGSAIDDKIGTNVALNSYYVYNGDNVDGDSLPHHYGANPPAQSITFLRNENSSADFRMKKHITQKVQNSVTGDPEYLSHYYNYLNGLWKDNSPLTYGGNGYGGDLACDYIYPGDSDPTGIGTNGVPQQSWFQSDVDYADYRSVGSVGPFSFDSGEMLELNLALVWSRGENGAQSSVNKLFGDIENVINWYKEGDFPSNYNFNVNVEGKEIVKSFILYPNPAKNKLTIELPTDNTYEYAISNIAGQVVKLGMLSQVQNEIQISELPRGTYVIKFFDGKSFSVNKFIKE